jgi:hypothetical protein
VSPFRPSFIPPPHLSSQPLDFVRPLFSWSYELLFPQPLYFDNDLRCTRGVGYRLLNAQYFNLQTRQILCSHTLADCWSSPKKSSHLESCKSELFGENTGGGVADYDQLCCMTRCLVNRILRPVAWLTIMYSPGKHARKPTTRATAMSRVGSPSTKIGSQFPAILNTSKRLGKRKTGARVRLRRRRAPVGRQGSVLPVERFHAWCYTDVRTCPISRNPVFPVAAEFGQVQLTPAFAVLF